MYRHGVDDKTRKKRKVELSRRGIRRLTEKHVAFRRELVDLVLDKTHKLNFEIHWARVQNAKSVEFWHSELETGKLEIFLLFEPIQRLYFSPTNGPNDGVDY
eukprot:scaffold203187_cov82-Attheya_sp.AAC.3